ncbi:MAG: hypothetical protein U0800_16710 [Isosphaeraceae bacterium]
MQGSSAECGPGRLPALFLGDLADPWVAGIAGALPEGSRAEACPGLLPATWPQSCPPADVLVLHRDALSIGDRDRLAALKRTQDPPPRVILCHGPHARPHHLETWLGLVDTFLPEATASEIVGGHVRPRESRERPDANVSIVGSQFEWRCALAEALAGAGYSVEQHRDWPSNPGELVIWDVPALDRRWPDLLERRTLGRRVAVLLEFADRGLVRAARSAGAAACLDSLCELDDLIGVIDRLAVAPPLPHGWRIRADGPSNPPGKPSQPAVAGRRRRATRPVDRAD